MKIKQVIRIVGLLIVSFLLINGKAMAMARRPYDYYREKLKEVDVTDGVSKEEAKIVTQNYVIDRIDDGKGFYKKFVISKPRVLEESEPGEDWVVSLPLRRGLNLIGPKVGIFYINKKSAEAVYGGEDK